MKHWKKLEFLSNFCM